MKLAVIILIYNQLRAAYLFGLFYFLSFNRCCNSDPTNKYGFTSFSIPSNDLKDVIHHNLEYSKHLLVCGLKEIIKYEKIDDGTKLEILYYFLDKIPDIKETTNFELNEIKSSKIINDMFIKIGNKNTSLIRHLNLLNAIIQVGEIRKFININSSNKTITPLSNEYINEIGELVKKVTSNTTKILSANSNDQDSLDNIKLCIFDNIIIWFKDLLLMNDNKNLYCANVDLIKIEGYIELIEKHYYNILINMTEPNIQKLVRLQNGLEFVHNAINIYYLASGKTSNLKSKSLSTEDLNIIVSKMIINTMLFFGALPVSIRLYECVITDQNIDFWCENKMIGYIDMFMFLYINKNNFSTGFPKYCDMVLYILEIDDDFKSTIKIAESLIKYLLSNLDNIDKMTIKYFNSYTKSIELEDGIKRAKRKSNNLQEAIKII